tara:strand:+ start:1957 stop:2271 length:315 start_codon:yes stop_codon:yes gene_type:complete
MNIKELALVCGIVVPPIAFATINFSQNPDGFIPMWSEQKGKGYETTLINTRQIISITPIFDPALVLSKVRNPRSEYLDVTFSDGTRLTVDEQYEDFKKRVRDGR